MIAVNGLANGGTVLIITEEHRRDVPASSPKGQVGNHLPDDKAARKGGVQHWSHLLSQSPECTHEAIFFRRISSLKSHPSAFLKGNQRALEVFHAASQ